MSRNSATISSGLPSAHAAAGVLDDWGWRWFQTFSRQGQEMSKRFFSVGCILAAGGILPVGLPSVGFPAAAKAEGKPNFRGFDAHNAHQPCTACPCL